MKAGELLAPNFFSDALRREESRDIDARDYQQQKNHYKEFMATTTNDSDKERYLCETNLLLHIIWVSVYMIVVI